MSKKVIIVVVSAVAVLAVASAAVYYFFLRKPAEIPEEAKVTQEERVRLSLTDDETASGLTLEQKIAKIEKDRKLALEKGEEIESIEVDVPTVRSINENNTIATTISPDGQSLYYYDPEKGELYMSDLDGSNAKAITSANFQNVYDIEWSENKDKAVIAFSENDGQDKKYSLFDLNTQETVSYNENFQAVTLSPDQDQIAYVYQDEESDTSNISVADPYDTSNYQSVYRHTQPNADLTWLDDKNIAAGPNELEMTGYTEMNLYTGVKTDDSTYRACVGEQYSVSMVEAGLSPNKQQIIFNQSDAKNPRGLSLYVVDASCLEKPKDLGIKTLVSKCAWAKDNKTVYCGVPDFWPDNMVMPNDYRDGRFVSTDSFYKINTADQTVELIAASNEFAGIFDVEAKSVSNDYKIFYYKNRVDNYTYALNVPRKVIEGPAT
ncbi:hypothetical protein KJ903_04945 [Patescibacteria group bacterium]|nr:hypothetical protein [Patescibacteria group bacterium]